MMPAKVAAAILRSSADCVEENSYGGCHNPFRARELVGIPEGLVQVARSVQEYRELLLKPPSEGTSKETEVVRGVVNADQEKLDETATINAEISTAREKPVTPLTTRRLLALVNKSVAKPDSGVLADLARKLKTLKARYEPLHAEWFAALRSGDIVCYAGWCNPAEVVCIDRIESFPMVHIRDLGDGEVKKVFSHDLRPFDTVDIANRKNSVRVKGIADRLSEAAKTGDTKTIDLLEEALKMGGSR